MNSKLCVYTPLGLDGYELCQPVRQDDFEAINIDVNGVPRQSIWRPIPMRIVREDEGQKLATSDSPWLGANALIFRPNAVAALGHLLRNNGELLPLECPEAELSIYNATRIVDALDESASSVLRFSNGRIMLVQRYVFRAEAIDDIDVFKIPNLRVSPTFLSQHFVDRWKTSGLRGLEFKQVWAEPN